MPGDATTALDGDIELVLDLSRLLSRTLHVTPTGVDRVELAYARELQRRLPAHQLAFGVRHPTGRYGRVPTARAERFLDAVEQCWASGSDGSARTRRIAADALATLLLMRPGPIPPRRTRRAYLQSSPHHLHDEAAVRAILRREDAAFLCLLHDLIPIEYPEYARPGGAELHLRRVRTVARLADAVIANSAATARSFETYLADEGRAHVPIAVAHLGLPDAPAPVETHASLAAPYFLIIGTIEPRKNHLLLLNLWRDMVRDLGAATPRLILVGRRGWENEQVLDMLDRCPALAGHVEEHAGLPDRAVRALLAGASGLLLPSFAEGFGLPVPEALALGVPVLSSDLPALREAGGDAPHYLDPLDGPGWRRAILALADPGDPMREDLLRRTRQWRAPTWRAHISVVLDEINRVAR